MGVAACADALLDAVLCLEDEPACAMCTLLLCYAPFNGNSQHAWPSGSLHLATNNHAKPTALKLVLRSKHQVMV